MRASTDSGRLPGSREAVAAGLQEGRRGPGGLFSGPGRLWQQQLATAPAAQSMSDSPLARLQERMELEMAHWHSKYNMQDIMKRAEERQNLLSEQAHLEAFDMSVYSHIHPPLEGYQQAFTILAHQRV